jgi:23S rRNA (cytidine2498-2'-O)-methyltransferase
METHSHLDATADSGTGFLLCGCQPGAEAALRGRVAEVVTGLKPAAWRRGVVTFRTADGVRASTARVEAESVFARAVMHSLGQVTGDDVATVVREAVALARAKGIEPQNVHVWHRVTPVGRGAPEALTAAADARAILLDVLGLDLSLPAEAEAGSHVLDCVIDSESRWWVGWHTADSVPSRWPGGFHPAAFSELPKGIVSRAWLKLDEAVRVFEIPLAAGQRAIELGAAPGGACQRLLEAGLHVVGVDPALVDTVVSSRPRFTQWRMRAREVPLDKFRGCDWLVADMNIDPQSTLASLGRAATARGVKLQGIIATLKIPDWARAAELSGWLTTIRSWGFEPRARQLSTSGREVCVVALPSDASKLPKRREMEKLKPPRPRRAKRPREA